MDESAAALKQTPVGVVVGRSDIRIWGMTSTERLRRSLARAGVSEMAPEGTDRPAVVVRAGWVLDESLVKALVARPNVVLVSDDDEPVAMNGENGASIAASLAAGRAPPGAPQLRAEELVPAYNVALRKREAPMLVRLTPAAVPAVERRMFGGSYKGVTDFVTKYVWPRPAQAVTKLCAVLGLTPNLVTAVGAVLTLAAFWLFWRGEFGLGLVCAWVMTFLDTVDGKLARVTLTSSKIGNAFDHGIDLIHPPFWWWAWLVGVQQGATPVGNPHLVLVVTVGGYVAQRIQEGIFLARHKLEIHTWRRFDSWFRLITARRNPNLVILTLATLAGRPDIGIEWVAIWTAICFAVHAVQIVQAEAARRHGKIESWMAV